MVLNQTLKKGLQVFVGIVLLIFLTVGCSSSKEDSDLSSQTSDSTVTSTTDETSDTTTAETSTKKAKIAFARAGDIYIMDADGSNQKKITASTGDNYYAPTVSPDGTKIAFINETDNNIYRINIDGTGMINITNNDNSSHSPDWFSDGTKIAFARGGDIYTMNADGSNQVKITDSGTDTYYDLSVSPDGTKIVFVNETDLNIYVINIDGTGFASITSGGSFSEPDWFPDGTKIAYACGIDICFMNADGTNQKQVTASTGDNYFGPAVSPDGTKIAFVNETNLNIYVINIDGTGMTKITNSDEFDPCWFLASEK